MGAREEFRGKFVTLFRTAGLGEKDSEEYADAAMELVEPQIAKMCKAAIDLHERAQAAELAKKGKSLD